jgi:hypothetical protein
MAALLVWKHAVPFLPPQDQYTEEKALPYPSERDSIDGLISLLRRHIPMGHILARSFEEWEKAFAIEGDSRDGPIAQARIMISGEMTPPLRRQDPVEGYRAISRILSKEIPL